MARTRRELITDAVLVILAAAIGVLLLVTRSGTQAPTWGHQVPVLDVTVGAISCAALWFARRWPVGVAMLTLVTLLISLSSGAPSFISVCIVGARCRTRVTLTVAALHQLAMIPYYFIWETKYPFWAVMALSLTEQAALVTLGMYIRARRQLLDSLHERIEHAEATQLLLADQARHAERARIATEMHDVLAHRVSLMALQAGALEIRPDLPHAEVRQTAALIRTTARQALTELRDVIGVLREDAEARYAPPPTLPDIATLVAEFREAGLQIDLDMQVETPAAAPAPLGRDTYRIVREALTNVTKHARGTTATVHLSGGPGDGLRVEVRNKLPLTRHATTLPGAGLGLVGLAERVTLAGGTLTHGPDEAGNFVLTASMTWLFITSCGACPR
jgi:signal transduction histidine kinase